MDAADTTMIAEASYDPVSEKLNPPITAVPVETSPPFNGGTKTLSDRLKELKEAKDSGLVSDAEYTQARNVIIGITDTTHAPPVPAPAPIVWAPSAPAGQEMAREPLKATAKSIFDRTK